MDLWNLDVDWLIIFQVLLASARFIEKIVYMNVDENNQPISDQISKVHVHLNQISHYIKTHEIWAKKLLFLSIWNRTIFEFIYALACIWVYFDSTFSSLETPGKNIFLTSNSEQRKILRLMMYIDIWFIWHLPTFSRFG